MQEMEKFEKLVWIMDRLRDPERGCPWDREQSYSTLRGYLLEECYEVADALDRGELDQLREELGDLMFQIVFLSRLAKEQGAFTATDVVRGIAEKMVRRHPHVFGSATAETSGDVLKHWEEIKRREKAGGGSKDEAHEVSVLDGTPTALPALLRAQRLGVKASRVGFDWREPVEVLDKVDEELGELREVIRAGERDRIREEYGDLLFALVSLARKLELDPEQALALSNLKFEGRFRRLEGELRRRGVEPEQAGLELLDQLWGKVKGE